MSRYRGPRLRIIRRLGELPGLTQKTSKKLNPPGQHGAALATQKTSPYGLRLKEKQKLRFHYGLTEGQLLRYIRQARQAKGSTGETLLQLLEMRLDNIIYRLGMAPTILAARQLVLHGHIVLNQKSINIPSYQCGLQDEISVKSTKSSKDLIQSCFDQSGKRVLPAHLSLSITDFKAKVTQMISRTDIGLKLNELLVVEFYSRQA